MKKNIIHNSLFIIHDSRGFIAFTSLLIISAVTLAIALSISLLGISAANTALGFKKGQETLKICEGCLEESLLRLRDNVNYSGGSLAVGNGNCTITVSGTGSSRTIDITSIIAGPPQYVKKIRATVKRTGNSLNLLTWLEVE